MSLEIALPHSANVIPHVCREFSLTRCRLFLFPTPEIGALKQLLPQIVANTGRKATSFFDDVTSMRPSCIEFSSDAEGVTAVPALNVFTSNLVIEARVINARHI